MQRVACWPFIASGCILDGYLSLELNGYDSTLSTPPENVVHLDACETGIVILTGRVCQRMELSLEADGYMVLFSLVCHSPMSFII